MGETVKWSYIFVDWVIVDRDRWQQVFLIKTP